MGAIGLPDSLGRSVHVVASVAAVDMYVYESGRDIAISSVHHDVRRAARSALGYAYNLAIDALDGATLQNFIGKNHPAGKCYACRGHKKRIS